MNNPSVKAMGLLAAITALQPSDLTQGRLYDRHVPEILRPTKRKKTRSDRKKLNKISKESRKANR